MLILRLAFRNLFRNTRRTLLTCLLISTSLAVIIVTDGIVIGMVTLMTSSITKTLAGEVQVHQRGFLDNYDVDLYIQQPGPTFAALDNDPAVAAWAPRAISGGMITSSYNVTGGLVYGIAADKEVATSRLGEAVTGGAFLSGAEREILLGEPLLELLEVKLGDRIVVTLAEAGSGEIAQELFRVSGTFLTGQPELDRNLVLINLAVAQRLLGLGGGVHEVAVQYRDPELAKQRDYPLLATLTDADQEALIWLDFNPAIGAMIEMINLPTLIIGIIMFVLAALGVINSMFMSIYERIYEFGVVRAIGTAPAQVFQLVMLEALLLAILSAVAGAMLGYLLNAYFATYGIPMGEFEVTGIVLDGNIRTELAIYQFVTFPLAVIALTLVAALYPAWYAARLTPAQALHKSL